MSHKKERSTYTLSDEGLCLTQASVFKIEKRRDTVAGVVLCSQTNERFDAVLLKVTVFGVEFWADQKTGQLYDTETLRCLTGSTLSLQVDPAPSIAAAA